MKPASQIAAEALEELQWHHSAGKCEALTQSETLHGYGGSPVGISPVLRAASSSHNSETTTTTTTAAPASASHTPADVHYHRADQIRAQRQAVLDDAYSARPDRFHQPPHAPRIPEAAWINQPQETPLATTT